MDPVREKLNSEIEQKGTKNLDELVKKEDIRKVIEQESAKMIDKFKNEEESVTNKLKEVAEKLNEVIHK